MLYRIPGLGVRNAKRIVAIRKYAFLRNADLNKLRVNIKKCLPFIITGDHQPARLEIDSKKLRALHAPPPEQFELDFSAPVKVPRAEVIGGEF